MKQITINRKYILQTWLWMLLLLFIACDDMEDKPSIPNIDGSNISETGTAELYILSEGLFNLNNSSLARYSFKKGKLTKNYFKDLNKRGLGDTANDMALYGWQIIHCSQCIQYH